MAIITAITEQKNKERRNIFLDGQFYCGLMALTVAQFKLKEGSEIEPSELSRLIAESERNRAYDKAAGYLGLKRRTKREIETYLKGKGFETDAIDYATGLLIEYGFLDDLQYAKDYVEQSIKKYGQFMLRQKLYMRGVDSEIIDEVLRELDGDEVFLSAVAAAEKYMAYKEFDQATKQKLLRFLNGRGFEFDVSKRAAEKVFEDYLKEEDL